eukprot:COSAG02_NODE_23708_length_710_cov_1.283142_2_plen_94_part_00
MDVFNDDLSAFHEWMEKLQGQSYYKNLTDAHVESAQGVDFDYFALISLSKSMRPRSRTIIPKCTDLAMPDGYLSLSQEYPFFIKKSLEANDYI